MKLTPLLILFGIILAPILSQADDPAAAKQAKLSRLLDQAQELQWTGRFHLAQKRFRAALQLDPENVAARAGEQQVEAALARPHPVEVRDAQELYHPVYPAERVGASSKPSQ